MSSSAGVRTRHLRRGTNEPKVKKVVTSHAQKTYEKYDASVQILSNLCSSQSIVNLIVRILFL